MASRNQQSSRMKFFEQHTFANGHADPLEVDNVGNYEIASTESGNMRGLYNYLMSLLFLIS